MMVKICGITRLSDARAAIEHGADALGFILWPGSPRFVGPDTVRTIVDALPPETMIVGVFVNQPIDEVNAFASRAGLTHVQLHGDESPAFAAAVTRPVIKATSLQGRPPSLDGWPEDTLWLIDAHDPQRRGGTGTMADWEGAARLAGRRRVLLAGGLTPENVADAVGRVRPFGIDVSSGVEKTPGVKDHDRIAALMAAVRHSAATEDR